MSVTVEPPPTLRSCMLRAYSAQNRVFIVCMMCGVILFAPASTDDKSVILWMGEGVTEYLIN